MRTTRKVQRLQETIKAEIGTLNNHPWAGEYYLGDGLENNYMTIAPHAGFLYMHRGDIGPYYDNYGAVEEKDGKLRLSLSLPYEKYLGFAKELIPVAWGERKYLISADTMIFFCNQINDRMEPRNEVHGFCLLRRGDEKKEVVGFPTIPQEFKPYLRAKPIETEIVGVGKPISSWGESEVKKIVIQVTLKHGKKAGLLPGMELHVIKPANVSDTVTVKEVGEEQSEGVIIQYHLKRMLPSYMEKNPEIGWKLSTRSLWGSEKEDKAKKRIRSEEH